MRSAADFLQAVRASDFDVADALLPTLAGRQDPALRRAVADLHTHRHRWAEAATSLAGMADPDSKLRCNLCRNLDALKAARPTVYRAVLEAIEGEAGPYRPHALPQGGFTVAHVDGEKITPLSNDPAAQVRAAMTQLQPINARGDALAILSIGDGHALAALAASPPTLFLGRQQAIYVLEPDPSLLLASLLIHDFSGPLGPIEQPRVQWYVGPHWADAFRLDVLTDYCLVFPQVNVKQGGAAKEIETKLVSVLAELGKIDAAAAVAMNKHYSTLTAADHARALAGEAGRPPRVMLLTTRFSTVLQHSTRDAEDAFRRLGCETTLVIEPSTHHGITRSAMRRTMVDFKPDVVFQIDHHRFEHGDLFPPGLPFVNWIQDLLPHLMTPAAGEKLSAADFVLTPSLQRWVDDFAYPERQCLEFRKLTRVPPRPPARQSDGDRVVYVSNWSQKPQQIVDEITNGTSADFRPIVAEACQRMIGIYAAGGSLPSFGHVRGVLNQVLADKKSTADETLTRETTTRLADRLNNLLYRHQGLTWAATACQEFGLKLEIYGNGWDANPAFAKYAAGNVEYGAPLENLTRAAGVNLILEPFMCMVHQRLLDALAAGGFCLVRDHPANHTCSEWIDLIARANTAVSDAKQLRASVGGEDKERVDALVARCAELDGSPHGIDQVAAVRRLQDAGFFPANGPILPAIDAVTFDTAHQLGQRLLRASRDSIFRTDVAMRQRRFVEDRLSYHGGMKRVLEFVCERLRDSKPIRSKAKAA